MDYLKIGKIEGIALLILIALNQIVLNLPRTLLTSCGSSTPLNIIYVSILAFIVSYCVIKLFKNFANNDILDVCQFLGGKFLRNIVGILFIVYFIVYSGTLLRNFADNLMLVYFPKTPIYLLIILFLAVAVVANKLDPNTIIKTNIVIVPLVMINLIVAYFAVSSRFVPERIFPILGYGAKETFLTGASNIFAFSGLAYVYFILPMLKDKNSFKPICLIALGISTLYIFLGVTCLLFSFSDILSVKEMSPIYLLVRGTDWGRFAQRPDAIFFLGWILCLMSYLSIIIMFISRILKKIGNLSSKTPLIYAISALIFIMSLICNGVTQVRFIEEEIFKYFTISFVYIACLLILIFANIKYRKNNKQNSKESDLTYE